MEDHLEQREKHRTARVEVTEEHSHFIKILSRALSSLQKGGVVPPDLG